MMKIGGRVGFFTVEELPWKFRVVDFPVELALPWRHKVLWDSIANRMDQVVAFCHDQRLDVLTIYSAQGRLNDDEFLEWGESTIELADLLEVEAISLHPNMVRRKQDRILEQSVAMANLRALGGTDRFSIGTFDGKRGIFRPEEIIELGLPMTLDTSHVRDREKLMGLVDRYHQNIRTVHLSGVEGDYHHLPIDDFCLAVVGRLQMLGWSGNLVVDYMPWHHYRVRDDIVALTEFVKNGKCAGLLPVSDRYRHRPDRHGYCRDGTNG